MSQRALKRKIMLRERDHESKRQLIESYNLVIADLLERGESKISVLVHGLVWTRKGLEQELIESRQMLNDLRGRVRKDGRP